MSQILNHQIYCICNPNLHSKDLVNGVIQGLKMSKVICWSRRKKIDETIALIIKTRRQLEERAHPLLRSWGEAVAESHLHSFRKHRAETTERLRKERKLEERNENGKG